MKKLCPIPYCDVIFIKLKLQNITSDFVSQ